MCEEMKDPGTPCTNTQRKKHVTYLAMAASEVSVGLALIMQTYHQHKTLDVAELTALKDENEEFENLPVLFEGENLKTSGTH